MFCERSIDFWWEITDLQGPSSSLQSRSSPLTSRLHATYPQQQPHSSRGTGSSAAIWLGESGAGRISPPIIPSLSSSDEKSSGSPSSTSMRSSVSMGLLPPPDSGRVRGGVVAQRAAASGEALALASRRAGSSRSRRNRVLGPGIRSIGWPEPRGGSATGAGATGAATGRSSRSMGIVGSTRQIVLGAEENPQPQHRSEQAC